MFDYAFLLPVGVVVSTVAISAGVSGSNFWIPIYLLWLGLDPKLAFWVALLTMLFGFGSGVIRNLQAGTIDFNLVKAYGPWVIPATAFGAWYSTRVESAPLLLGFAVFLTVYGAYLAVQAWRPVTPSRLEAPDHETPDHEAPDTASRRTRPPRPAASRALLAGNLQGLIATGAGSLLLPCLLRHRVRRPADAVGATVVLVFLCSLTSVAFRIDRGLWLTLLEQQNQVLAIMAFVAPGVALGGQLGPRMIADLPLHWMRRYVSAILVAVGLLIFWRAVGR